MVNNIKNKLKSLGQSSGFTLVELLLYLSITALALGAVGSFLAVMYSNRTGSETSYEVEQQGAYVLSTILSTVNSASGVNVPPAGSSSSTLSLATLGSTTNPTIFALNSGILTIKEGTSTPVALNDYRTTISNLSFYNLSRSGTKDIIRASFAISYDGTSTKIMEFQYSKNFYGSASRR